MGQKTIVGDLNVTGAIKQNGTDIASTVVEISGSITNPETTIEITQEQYQKLLGDNVILKVNDSENGSLYLYKTNYGEQSNIAVYTNTITNISFSATVSQVETEDVPEYAVVISAQTLGGGTKLYKHTISFGNMGFQFSIITTDADIYNSFSALPQIGDCISVSPLAIQAMGASSIPYGRYLLGRHFYWIANTDYLYYRNSDANFSIDNNNIVVTNTETQVDGTENFTDTVTEL